MNLNPVSSDDPVGAETLALFSNASQFNRWMFDAIAPYCKGDILEIGSGIGNLSVHILQKAVTLTLSDLNISYCSLLQQRLGNEEKVKGIYQVDLSATDFEEQYRELLHRFDTIIALNVVEHIEDDTTAIRNCSKLLKPNGQVIILVPAFQGLYNSLDKELKHFRRYSRKQLSTLLTGQGFNISRMKYFNSPGIGGWWLSGNLLKRKIISKTQLTIYNKLVPLFRLIDKLVTPFMGLSVIAIAQRTETKP